jgi:hypothetical protein
MTVYRVIYNGQLHSIKAKTESGAAVFFVKHRVSASSYECECKDVSGKILYVVKADNFYYTVSVEPAEEMQGALL